MLKSRIFKKGSSGGLSVTEIGFGTAPLGNLYKPISDSEANLALEAAWNSGVRYYDTLVWIMGPPTWRWLRQKEITKLINPTKQRLLSL